MKKQHKKPTEGNKTGCRWFNKTTCLDLHTGEVITQTEADRNYIHIKTLKHASINRKGTIGQIEFTKLYERSRQGNLWENRYTTD